MSVIFRYVIRMFVKEYPNDQQLGEAVRKYVNKVNEFKKKADGENRNRKDSHL
jgi:uncharacterized protein (UPF0332 family)